MIETGHSLISMREELEELTLLDPDPPTKRSTCHRCRRPATVCWCPLLPETSIDIHGTIYILQHPSEEKRNLRTAIMLHLSLSENRCHVIRCKRFSEKKYSWLRSIAAHPTSILLYPGQNAVDLKDIFKDTCNLSDKFLNHINDGKSSESENGFPFTIANECRIKLDADVKLDKSVGKFTYLSIDDTGSHLMNGSSISLSRTSFDYGAKDVSTTIRASSLDDDFTVNASSSETICDISNNSSNPFPSYNLFVLDGTWLQAKAMYNQNKFLRTMKQARLTSALRSEYVIRTQPSDDCLSTLETVALAVSILEQNDSLYECLVHPLRLMCEHQLHHGAVVHQSKQYLKEHGLYKKQERMELRSEETSASRRKKRRRDRRKEKRISAGECFSVVNSLNGKTSECFDNKTGECFDKNSECLDKTSEHFDDISSESISIENTIR